ncbi:MAG TPA: shikimate dehydrogenase [Stellaceae bacterium]|nr:shikimate dehydrogenase [Stellaceae bacterium]
MGWPVAHSRSPLLHGFWLKQHGIAGAYELLPVPPEDLETALRGLAAQGFAGCNLTVPHKQAALAIVDHVDGTAARIGAVNTIIVRRDGALEGRNTDAFGFRENLRAAQPAWRASAGPAAVLGAGGAARAVVAALLDDGAPEIRLVNRSRDHAAALAAALGGPITVIDWSRRAAVLGDTALLVNTTSLGMAGRPPLDLALDALPKTAVVNDIVYAPLETPLLEAARRRGNPVVDGLGMLLHQARPAFAAWFGVTPDVTLALRQAVAASLVAR